MHALQGRASAWTRARGSPRPLFRNAIFILYYAADQQRLPAPGTEEEDGALQEAVLVQTGGAWDPRISTCRRLRRARDGILTHHARRPTSTAPPLTPPRSTQPQAPQPQPQPQLQKQLVATDAQLHHANSRNAHASSTSVSGVSGASGDAAAGGSDTGLHQLRRSLQMRRSMQLQELQPRVVGAARTSSHEQRDGQRRSLQGHRSPLSLGSSSTFSPTRGSPSTPSTRSLSCAHSTGSPSWGPPRAQRSSVVMVGPRLASCRSLRLLESLEVARHSSEHCTHG
jgi:hypothetical protein